MQKKRFPLATVLAIGGAVFLFWNARHYSPFTLGRKSLTNNVGGKLVAVHVLWLVGIGSACPLASRVCRQSSHSVSMEGRRRCDSLPCEES